MRDAAWIAGALVLSLGLRAVLLAYGSVPFNGDEAVVALMGRHILGGARPVFFYGQAYMGSLDAYLVAAMFRIMGESVTALRILQSLLYLLYILTLVWLARLLFVSPKIGLISAWLAAVPAVVVTTYTTATLGGYGEVLVLGNLILIFGYSVTHGDCQDAWWAWICLGIAGGLAFWTLGIAVVYLLPAAILAATRFQLRRLPYYLITIMAFAFGSSPWWWYNLRTAWGGLEVVGSPAGVIGAGMHLFGLVFLGLPSLLNLRFPWTPDYAPIWLLLAALAIYTGLGLQWVYARKMEMRLVKPAAGFMLAIFVLGYLALFSLTRFGVDSSGRYQLPLYFLVVFALACCVWLGERRRKWIGLGLLAGLLAFNAFQTFRAASSSEGLTTQFGPSTRFGNQDDQALIQFLTEHGETRGYTNYWVAYRLAFLSDESLIYLPRLPYRSDLSYSRHDNRYPPYTDMVADSQKIAYITTLNPQLESNLRRRLKAKGLSFQEEQIGVYTVFYQIAQPVHPDGLDLGIREQ